MATPPAFRLSPHGAAVRAFCCLVIAGLLSTPMGDDVRMVSEANPDRVNVLLVEDDERMIEVFVEHFGETGVDFLIARSKAEADELIRADFRVAVCDLSIPTNTGRLDTSAEHGTAVISRLLEERPQAQIIVFSGSIASSRLRESADAARLRFFAKSSLPECVAEAKRLASSGGQ